MAYDPGIVHRLFFALRPDPAVARQAAVFIEGEAPGAAVQDWRRLHLTLAITDDFRLFPRTLADGLLRVGERSALAVPRFEVMLDRLAGGGRSIALRPGSPDPAIRDLARRLATGMAGEGIAARDGWRFSPHVTLAYRVGAPVNRSCRPFAWTADRLFLIHSLVGRTRHLVLGEWPLAGRRIGDPLQSDLFD